MYVYFTSLKQAVLPPAPHWSLAAPYLLENSLRLRAFSGLPLTAGLPWFLSLTSSRIAASAVLHSPGEQNPPDTNSHSRSKQPGTSSSRGRRSLSTSFPDPQSKPCLCFRPERLPYFGPILPPSRKSVASRRARNFRAGSRGVPVASCRSQPFRVSTGRNRSNSSPRGQIARSAFVFLCSAFAQFYVGTSSP